MELAEQTQKEAIKEMVTFLKFKRLMFRFANHLVERGVFVTPRAFYSAAKYNTQTGWQEKALYLFKTWRNRYE